MSTSLLVPPVMYGSKSLHQLHSSKDIENHCRVLRLVSRATLRGFVGVTDGSASGRRIGKCGGLGTILATAGVVLIYNLQVTTCGSLWCIGN